MKKILLSTLLISTLALAQDAKEEKTFTSHTELGYTETKGNTETKTFKLDAKADKSWDAHKIGIITDAQYSSDHEIETSNKYSIELNYDYAISDAFAFSYLAGYQKDMFSSLDHIMYTGPGMKYKALNSERQKLSLDANILYTQEEDLVQETLEYSAYRAKLTYLLEITKNLKFDQELSYRGSFEDAQNYFVDSKSSLFSKISDVFSAGLSYKVNYANISAPKEQTDTTLTASIIIDY